MVDGIDRGGLNMGGMRHEDGNTGVSDNTRQRIKWAQELDDLEQRVSALEREQRERKLP